MDFSIRYSRLVVGYLSGFLIEASGSEVESNVREVVKLVSKSFGPNWIARCQSMASKG